MREDPFANGGATPAAGSRGFAQVMKEQQLKHVEADLSKQMKDRAKEGTLKVSVDNWLNNSGLPFHSVE